MGMVLHGLADDVGHLGETAVVDPVHGMEHPPLDRFESIDDVGDGPLEDYIGRVVEEPVLEHAGKLEFPAVAAEEPRELPVPGLFVDDFFFLSFFRLFPDIIPFFTHILSVFLSVLLCFHQCQSWHSWREGSFSGNPWPPSAV